MKNQKGWLNYSLISKYRSLLMGVAILLIVFCHLDVAQRHNGIDHTHLAGLLQTGSVGVDIFVLLSGIGLYYSYSKNQPPYWTFEKKRVLRILPYYLVIGGMTYFIYDIIIRHFSFGTFLCDLFFISWFKGTSTRYWYVLAILVFYLLFPVLYSFVHSRKNALIRISLFCIIWFAVAEILCRSFDWLSTFRIALERLPIFMVGIYVGKLSKEEQKITRIHIIIYILTGLILLVLQKRVLHNSWPGYLHYPIRGALAVSIISIVVLFMEMMERISSKTYRIISASLVWLGGLTYEIYLFHQSYMILFEFPYKLHLYFLVAFLLPVVTAAGILCIKKSYKEEKT